MSTFETAEKYFLGSPSSNALPVWSAGSSGFSLNLVRSESPTDGDNVGNYASNYTPRRVSGQESLKTKIGGSWLRKHVKDRLGSRKFGSQENILTRSFERSGTLAPVIEERRIQTHREYGSRSYNVNNGHDRNLFQSLKRYHSSSSILTGLSPYIGPENYFHKSNLGKKMTAIGSTRLYRSSPQLTRNAQLNLPSNEGKLPDIKSTSVPGNISNYVGGGSAGKLPNISNDSGTSDSSITSSGRRKKRKQLRSQENAKRLGGDADTLGGTSGSTFNTGTSISVVKEDEEEEDEYMYDYEDEKDGEDEPQPTLQMDIDQENERDSKYVEAERLAEEEVRHNWLLSEENISRVKRFEARKNRLLIRVSDNDTLDAIEDRLEELRMMAKPRKDEGSVLDKLTPAQREKILKMKNTPISTLNKQRRKGWKEAILVAKTVKMIGRPLYKLRWACNMVVLLSKTVENRRQYYVNQQESDRMRRKIDNDSEFTEDPVTPDKPSLSLELLLALTMQPNLRTTKTVKRILWLLRATKAFKNLFPAEMELELAKVVGYERYDDGRVISRQGRAPERFYYIISGKVGLYRQYKLSTGQVTKGMGFLTKGMTTDPEQLERGLVSEDSLVAKGQVEVLIVDKEAFSFLQHTTVGPPIDFLKSLDLFEEFPVERFGQSSDAIEYTYYGTGKLIVPDSNRTPWLHIIKSGHVKVVRTQTVIDARATNESKFDTPRIEALGCGKTFSHANAMLGVQAKQKKQKATATVKLPEIGQKEALVSNPFGTTLGVESLTSRARDHEDISEYRSTASTARSKRSKKSKMDEMNEDEEWDERDSNMNDTESESSRHVDISEPEKDEENQEEPPQEAEEDVDQTNDTEPSNSESNAEGDQAATSAKEKRRRKDATLPIINIPVRDASDVYQPHAIWLTRERTEAEAGILPPDGKHPKKKEAVQRPAYLQLGVLTIGDVFGLDHMQPALASEAQGVSLLSDGAEVIKISKRFFLQNAGNNTMLKVETMANEYISEDEAKKVLFDKETWSQYKAALWERMTANRPLVTT